MTKARGDRRTSRVKLKRVLDRIGQGRFTTAELIAACKIERVKYDTVQRALQREQMIALDGIALGPDGKVPRGSPERTYIVMGWAEEEKATA